MNFRIVALFIIAILISCEGKIEIVEDIEVLRASRLILEEETDSLTSVKNDLEKDIYGLINKQNELNITNNGETPKYMLKLHLEELHMTLSIKKHLKDAMNAIDFEIPVDKDFYESVTIGTNIIDEFKFGSFVLNGSFGDYQMTVEGKEIR
jgi:hypothetical protein